VVADVVHDAVAHVGTFWCRCGVRSSYHDREQFARWAALPRWRVAAVRLCVERSRGVRALVIIAGAHSIIPWQLRHLHGRSTR